MGTGGSLPSFNTIIRALRIHVTVHEGDSQYRLTAMISPPNGATPVQSTATNTPTAASNAAAGNNPAAAGAGAVQARGGQAAAANGRGAAAATGRAGAAATGRAGAGATAAAANTTTSLRYPFTVIEIRENYEPPQLSAPTEEAPPL